MNNTLNPQHIVRIVTSQFCNGIIHLKWQNWESLWGFSFSLSESTRADTPEETHHKICTDISLATKSRVNTPLSIDSDRHPSRSDCVTSIFMLFNWSLRHLNWKFNTTEKAKSCTFICFLCSSGYLAESHSGWVTDPAPIMPVDPFRPTTNTGLSQAKTSVWTGDICETVRLLTQLLMANQNKSQTHKWIIYTRVYI